MIQVFKRIKEIKSLLFHKVELSFFENFLNFKRLSFNKPLSILNKDLNMLFNLILRLKNFSLENNKLILCKRTQLTEECPCKFFNIKVSFNRNNNL